MSNLKRVLEVPRELSHFEKSSMLKMISYLPNNEILITQIVHAEVVSVCDCGCRTIDIRVPSNLEKYTCSQRIPVEMMVELEGESAPILFQLHVVDGYINELEILKLDSTPIYEEIDINKGVVEVRI